MPYGKLLTLGLHLGYHYPSPSYTVIPQLTQSRIDYQMVKINRLNLQDMALTIISLIDLSYMESLLQSLQYLVLLATQFQFSYLQDLT